MSVVVLIFLTISGSKASADGISFDPRGLPNSPHTVLRLAGIQQQWIASAPRRENEGRRFFRIRIPLTESQTNLIERETGQRITWVEVGNQSAFSGCLCGEVNASVFLRPDRLALIHATIDSEQVIAHQLSGSGVTRIIRISRDFDG